MADKTKWGGGGGCGRETVWLKWSNETHQVAVYTRREREGLKMEAKVESTVGTSSEKAGFQ